MVACFSAGRVAKREAAVDFATKRENAMNRKSPTVAGLSSLIRIYKREQQFNREQEEREDRGRRRREIATLVFVILTTIGIFIQAIILHLSDDTFRETLTNQKETTERQLRAYVFLGPPRKSPDFVGTPQVSGMLTIKNSGLTPAYNLTHWQRVEFLDFPNTPESDFLRKNARPAAPTVVNPGVDIGAPFIGPVLSDDQRQMVRAGSKALYIFGEIRYVDAFKKPHISKFRYVINENALLLGGSMVYAEHGNCADEFCPTDAP